MNVGKENLLRKKKSWELLHLPYRVSACNLMMCFPYHPNDPSPIPSLETKQTNGIENRSILSNAIYIFCLCNEFIPAVRVA